MKPPHWRCRGCGIIITDCGSAPATCRFCQSTSGFEYMGYEGDYDLHKETEQYRILHGKIDDEPKAPSFSGQESGSEDLSAIHILLKPKEKKDKNE